jgi:hypothetical protein
MLFKGFAHFGRVRVKEREMKNERPKIEDDMER